jgi:3-oxoacyl-[acyl-carrier protein] reductase
MELGLDGRTAAVAASSAGLGFACAHALAREGVTVAICGRDEGRIQQAAERIGPGAIPLVVDVGSAEGGRTFVEQATAALGTSPDILVTNAGGPPRGGFDDTGIDDFRRALELNLLSTIAMCETAIPAMRQRGWGRVLAITSVVVKQPAPYLILSNTARAGVHGFLKTTAGAVARDGVTVNALLPGGHATDRMKALYGDEGAVAANIPVGRLGRPEDFGATAAFLCSEHARFITGSSLALDGGSYGGLF